MPEWSGRLCNLYWFLRYHRKYDEAKRRKLYRQIADEKKRLHETGVDAELVRLLCRYLSNPKNRHAEGRYLFYKSQQRLFDDPEYTRNI